MIQKLMRLISVIIVMAILVTSTVFYSSAANDTIADGTYHCYAKTVASLKSNNEKPNITITFKIVIKNGQAIQCKITDIRGESYSGDGSICNHYLAGTNNLDYTFKQSGNIVNITVKNKQGKYTWFWHSVDWVEYTDRYVWIDGMPYPDNTSSLGLSEPLRGTISANFSFQFK